MLLNFLATCQCNKNRRIHEIRRSHRVDDSRYTGSRTLLSAISAGCAMMKMAAGRRPGHQRLFLIRLTKTHCTTTANVHSPQARIEARPPAIVRESLPIQSRCTDKDCSTTPFSNPASAPYIKVGRQYLACIKSAQAEMVATLRGTGCESLGPARSYTTTRSRLSLTVRTVKWLVSARPVLLGDHARVAGLGPPFPE